MKLLQELIMLMAVAIGGYILYRIYKSVGAASQAVGSAAQQWTPGNIASTVASDISSAAGAVTSLFTSPVDSIINPPDLPVNLTAGMPTDYYYGAFVDSALSQPFQPPLIYGVGL